MHADLAKLLLRLTLGALILLHGIDKVLHGTALVSRSLAAAGWPSMLMYGVYVGEVVAPVLLILGIWSRAAAGAIVFNMLVAVALVHSGQLLALNGAGGWSLELQAMFFATALGLCLLGAGRYSLAGTAGRWN